MFIHVAETFWGQPEDEDWEVRWAAPFSGKSYWMAFGDHWNWFSAREQPRRGQRPRCLAVCLSTVTGKDDLKQVIRAFRREPGHGVLVLGGHGGYDQGQHTLKVLPAQGSPEQFSLEDIKEFLNKGRKNSLRDKILILDSCSLVAEKGAVVKLMRSTGLGMVMGFRKAVDVLDSVLLELAFVSCLLQKLEHGSKFRSLVGVNDPLKSFAPRYGSLARALGMRVWATRADGPKEIWHVRQPPPALINIDADGNGDWLRHACTEERRSGSRRRRGAPPTS